MKAAYARLGELGISAGIWIWPAGGLGGVSEMGEEDSITFHVTRFRYS